MTVYADIAEGDAQTGTVQSASEIARLASELNNADDPAQITLIGIEDALKNVRSDFGVASKVQNLVEEDVLDLLSVPEVNNSVFCDGAIVRSYITTGESGIEVTEESDENVSTVSEYLDTLKDNAEPFPLRTAAYDTVVETLTEEFGEAMAADFEDEFNVRDFTGPMDEVDLFLLLASQHEELLYDISKWGEDIGIASKATFSRSKTEMEDMEFLETEKVPIDVGRPRLRLKIPEEIRGGDVGETVQQYVSQQA